MVSGHIKGAGGGYSVGYDPYDLFDLGEFDQKGTVPTKYGTKEQYLDATKTLKRKGIRVVADKIPYDGCIRGIYMV